MNVSKPDYVIQTKPRIDMSYGVILCVSIVGGLFWIGVAAYAPAVWNFLKAML